MSNGRVRRAILKSRLGEREAAESDFATALTTPTPRSHEPYAALLSYLVVAHPNLELAQSVLARAEGLSPEWKVLLALRVQAVAARAGAEPSRDVAALLGAIRGDSWIARLASFGRGQLDYEALLAAASTPGERAQAQFYQGARLLGGGDVEGARSLFRRVLENGTVLLDEHWMASELSSSLPANTSAQAAP